MLSIGQRELAGALEEVGRSEVCNIGGALLPEARHELLMVLEGLEFQRAPRLVGEVRQDFDLLALNANPSSQAAVPADLMTLVETYTALLRATAISSDKPSLADFKPTDIHVQRYGAGSVGISPHRDSQQFIKLICIFSFGSRAEFRLFRERRRPPQRRFQLNCGDLLLLRAPRFANHSSGPLHSVSGPAEGVRYSITLRMKKQPDRYPKG